MRAKLQQIKQELRTRMHEPIEATGKWLKRVVLGYYQYHAVPGNLQQLGRCRWRLARLWRYVLRRRSQKSRVTWKEIGPVLDRWIPAPRTLHPTRMCASTLVSKGGAVCGSSARTDLCGGRPAMAVPTATTMVAKTVEAQNGGRGPDTVSSPMGVVSQMIRLWKEKVNSDLLVTLAGALSPPELKKVVDSLLKFYLSRR
jgi:hypothetical protein